jgi:hypothetical protein
MEENAYAGYAVQVSVFIDRRNANRAFAIRAALEGVECPVLPAGVGHASKQSDCGQGGNSKE